VEHHQYDEWTEYANNHQGWVQESREIRLQRTERTWEEQHYDNTAIHSSIFRFDPDTDEELPINPNGPWEPLWQISPPPHRTNSINFDILETPEARSIRFAADAVHQTGVLSKVSDYSLRAKLAFATRGSRTLP